MVHVVPPEGWKPTQPPGQEAPPADGISPPPLDRVSESPLTLELDPPASPLAGLFRRLWILWLSAFAVLAVVIWALLSQLASPPTSEPVASTAERGATGTDRSNPPTTATESSKPHATATGKDERPATAPAGEDDEQLPPGTQSGDVKGPQGAPDNTSTSEDISPGRSATSSIPISPSASEALEPRPAMADLFPAAAEDRDAKDTPNEVKKRPPPPVDVADRLDDPIEGLEFTAVPLIGVMDLLARMSTAPITLDADAMAQLGVAPRDPISLRLEDTTVGEALRAAVAQRGLDVSVEAGSVIVTAPADYRQQPRKIRYTVSDLSGDDPAGVEKLATVIRRLVAPRTWSADGGGGTITPDGDALAVVQPAAVHRRVLVFCERLRKARGLPLRSREDRRLFTLETGAERAREMLARPVSANYHHPAPLIQILSFLGEAAGAEIIVDRAALALADTSDGVEATLVAGEQPLGEALTALLRPLGLTYRTLGRELIQVTTPDAVAERLEREFYPIGPWLERGIPAERLIEQLKARVAPSTWSDVGGEADICFDVPSKCLIVLQSQPAQAATERLLEKPPKQ